MSKSAMPVSKAKTAYKLLSEISALILEEPLRYDQGTFITQDAIRAERPACGTVCCVAGWVATLKTKHRVILRDPGAIEAFATETLGLNSAQAYRLFDANAAGDNEVDPAEHAKRGAEHIARFQTKYAKQLKAKRV